MGQILGILQVLLDIVTGIFGAIIMVYETTVGAITFLVSFVTFLPAVISSAVIVFIAVYVVRFMLLK